jgi:CPA1 family monovalent cation:H+ antiporter
MRDSSRFPGDLILMIAAIETAIRGNPFDTAAVLLVLAALFSYVNHRFLKLPFTIGILVSGLAASLAVLATDAVLPGLGLGEAFRTTIERRVDFHESLMHGMLSFLLFAGAMHVDLDDLLSAKVPVVALASVGVVISTAVVGIGSYALFRLVGVPVPFPLCLVFGALISPTDPIAVLGIMKSAGAPRSLEIKVAGESLFNDGIGVVVFLVLGAAAGIGGSGARGASGGALHVLEILAVEVAGGVLLGLATGLLCYAAMKSLEDPNLEILFSVALVMGITFLAFRLHTSAPLACVVAGIFIGNHGRRFAMSKEVRTALDHVWSFVDEALNAILFLLIGLEVVAVSLTGRHIAAATILIPLALVARFLAVLLPITFLRGLRHPFTPGAVRILTWGGLKGGISVALALSLREKLGASETPGGSESYEAIVTATYAIVLFSILVQGLTIGRLVRTVVPEESEGESRKLY